MNEKQLEVFREIARDVIDLARLQTIIAAVGFLVYQIFKLMGGM